MPASHPIATPSEPVVVFDIGNVLVEWDPRILYRRLFGNAERADWFVTTICTAWNHEQDRGRSWAEGVADLSARHPEWADAIAAYDTHWLETVGGYIPQSHAVFAALKARGRPVYGLSNISVDKFAVLAEAYPLMRAFDGVLRSGEVGLLKPEPAIYRVFLERFGLRADACVFIDDSPANVAAARAIGMAAIHFTPATDLAAELGRLGVRLDTAADA